MEDGADTVIDGIVEVVGSNGTVITPTFALLAPSGAVRLMVLPAEVALDGWRHQRGLAMQARGAAQLPSLPFSRRDRKAQAQVDRTPWCCARTHKSVVRPAFAHDSPLELLVRWDACRVLCRVNYGAQKILDCVESIPADVVGRRAPSSARQGLHLGIHR